MVAVEAHFMIKPTPLYNNNATMATLRHIVIYEVAIQFLSNFFSRRSIQFCEKRARRQKNLEEILVSLNISSPVVLRGIGISRGKQYAPRGIHHVINIT